MVQRGDYGPYIQSERLKIYEQYKQELIEKGSAYYCFCSKERLEKVREAQREKGQTPMYDGHCRHLSKDEVEERLSKGESAVLRLKVPEDENVQFEDKVRGTITIHSKEVDDQVLIKSDGFPTYHFAVVVDDHLMKISHVIRGEEWLPSTPKHVILYEAFGWDKPTYVHLPNILNKDKKKLSKRQGDVAVEDFLRKGYLPEALINYIALLGWSPEDNKELFTMKELIEAFDMTRVNKSGAVFDVEKLNWMNQIYLREMDPQELLTLAKPYLLKSKHITEEDFDKNTEQMRLIVETFVEKTETLADFKREVDHLFDYNNELNEEMLAMLREESCEVLAQQAAAKIEKLEEFSPESLKKVFKEIQKEHGIKGKKLFMPARIIITKQMHGSDLMKSMTILGKEEVVRRFENYTAMI